MKLHVWVRWIENSQLYTSYKVFLNLQINWVFCEWVDAHCKHLHSRSCTFLFTRTTLSCYVRRPPLDRGRHSHSRTSWGEFTFGLSVLSVSLENVVLEGYTFIGERSMHLNLTPDARSPKEAIHAKSQSCTQVVYFYDFKESLKETFHHSDTWWTPQLPTNYKSDRGQILRK